jgi:branched-chain amino acid transport system permease protein
MFTPAILGQVVVNGVTLSAMYVLISLGFTLIFGIMRVVNFAHGSFAMLGGYALWYAYQRFHIPFVISIIVAPAVVAVASLIFERLVFRRFYHKMLPGMIGLLGLDIALVHISVLLWDVNERSIAPALPGIVKMGPTVVPANTILVVAIAAAVLLGFWGFMKHTRYGLAMRAVSQDVEIAQAQGVDARKIYMVAFMLAIFMTALAGALYSQTYALSPFVGARPLVVAFIVVILGGMGSIPGAALGGVLLGFAESFLSTFFGASVSQLVSFAVVIGLLIVRPWGLLGTRE